MTQHTDDFLHDCTTVTADGSLVSVDEVEGLYLYWRSLRAADSSGDRVDDSTRDSTDDSVETAAVLDALYARGVEPIQRNGVDYVEGLVLTGPVVADFIVVCDFAGVWGQPELWELAAVQEVVTAS
ncbi:hypothetical protein [Arthrobacter burdickii]|jgi:hypothetical protein|uniref:Uncharacterized protein n=1 Tax=Arthrobacter burdickii TaxID=3035920 RepID=A0ABT8K0A2_9MICC|nr:hypothetical protein [Arthrobacter burdickii]MDN4610856.1 hypothetical protein [Arthrobacter burdickii]